MNSFHPWSTVSRNTKALAGVVLLLGLCTSGTAHAQVCSCDTLDCTEPAPIAVSPRLCPFGSDGPEFFPEFDFGVLPVPTNTVRIRVQAHANIDTTANSLKLFLNGQKLSYCPFSCLFKSAVLYTDCAPHGDLSIADLTISAETFNSIVSGQHVVMDGVPEGYVDPFYCNQGSDCPTECSEDLDFCFDGFPYCLGEACCQAMCASEDNPPSYLIFSLIYDHPDCDGNNLQDACEMANNTVLDCNKNGVLDSCEILDPRLNCDIRFGNIVIDACQIANDPSQDCNTDRVIDRCEIDGDFLLDCDNNGTLDACETALDPTKDCDNNGTLDCCEVEYHGSCGCGRCYPYCEGPTCIECQQDLNHNCHPDQCDCVEDADCDDGFACTTDICNAVQVCVITRSNAFCREGGGFCGSDDVCNPDLPEHDPVTGCVKGNPCSHEGVHCKDPDVCVQGACCLSDGTCDDVLKDSCDLLGGDYLGDETACANGGCPPPRGACCVDDICIPSQEEVECIAAVGRWGGALSECDDASCLDPEIELVESVLVHGESPGIDIALNLSETNGIEPRRGGPNHLVFTINKNLNPATVLPESVQISCTVLPQAAVSEINLIDGRILSVVLDQSLSDLAGTPNCCTFAFPGIRTSMNESIDELFDVIALPGDLNFDLAVTGGDALIIKPWFGTTAGVDLPFPQMDFDLNGVVTGGDFALIKPILGNLAAPCPQAP